MNKSTIINTRSLLQNLTTAPPTAPLPNNLDASRGAAQLGIASQVWVHHDVVDTYGELDPGVGRNVVGAVLAVLDCHLASGGSFAGSEILPVCLRRREDGQPVEVDLLVRRLRKLGSRMPRHCRGGRAARQNCDQPTRDFHAFTLADFTALHES